MPAWPLGRPFQILGFALNFDSAVPTPDKIDSYAVDDAQNEYQRKKPWICGQPRPPHPRVDRRGF
jgi:hypothetical protein